MENTIYVVIAIVAVLALVGVVALSLVSIPLQQAEAGCLTGFIHSQNNSIRGTARAIENSQDRCLLHP